MRFIVTIFLFSTGLHHVMAQTGYGMFTSTVQKLRNAKGEALDHLWNDLVVAGQVPLVQEDSVAFLYRGEAQSVVWMGDFNGWGSSNNFHNSGQRVKGTNLWILKVLLPPDARLDYKIILNGNMYLLDPVNRNSQWSGVGGGSPNSELRMPEWTPDPITSRHLQDAPEGRIEKDLLFYSQTLGYQLTYSIYTPYAYPKDEPLPVIYVTDGYEYLHERLGNMITILDNLIHLGKIRPVMAVFIDHREPVNRSVNRRMQELAMNDHFLNFVCRELIPTVESQYSVSKDPAQRAILGTSLGGLSAAYFAITKPDLFGLAGMQSPAFWFKPDIYRLFEDASASPIRTFITTGVIYDDKESAQQMKTLLEKKNFTFEYREVNQGHSWGNFRDFIDDILVHFFAPG